jgi:hypothetical protein
MVHDRPSGTSHGATCGMREYYLETDSKAIFALPRLSYPIRFQLPNETIGGVLKAHFLPLPEDTSLVKSAWNTLCATRNQDIAGRSRALLSMLLETISSFRGFGFDMDYLPPVRAFNVDDGSVLIEWIFADFRIGFNIEPNPQDSNWYLVSNKKFGEIGASGFMSGAEIETKKSVVWLLSFILSNS